jgi:hypothetical protein
MKQYVYISFSIPKELCHDINIHDAIDDTSTEFLNSELEDHIQLYKNIIKNRYCYKYRNMPNITHMYCKFKINEKIEKEVLQYFWALKDGEIIIQKKIYPIKTGDIIIFPNSWVFPYELNFKYIN